MPLAAVILSGGESSRMGSPKALLPYRTTTFLGHLLDVARQSLSDPTQRSEADTTTVRVVLGAHVDEVTSALSLDPGIVVRNPNWREGQLSSIQAAIRTLQKASTDGFVLFLVDHPLVSAELVSKLVAEFYASGKPVVVPTFRGKRGHPVIFAKSLYDELLAAPTDKGARAVVWTHAVEVLEVPTEEEGILLNLNDPEVLRRAMG